MKQPALTTHEQCVPLLFPTTAGPCSTSLGLLSFTLDGLCSIGPHSFHYTQPIEFEYEGHRLFRAPKSNILEVTTPFGEVYRYRYFSHSHTWMEVRTYEKSPSSWPEIKRLFRDTFQQYGPLLGTVGVVYAATMMVYMAGPLTLLYLLWRGALYVVALVFSLCISHWLYVVHWGELSSHKSDEAILAAYFFPVGFVSLAIIQVIVAAWKNHSLWSWGTWRHIGIRLTSLTVATCALFYLYAQNVPLRPETLVTAWERAFETSATGDARATPPSSAKAPWSVQRAFDDLDPPIRPSRKSQQIEPQARNTN